MRKCLSKKSCSASGALQKGRLIFVSLLLFSVFGIISGRLWFLQVRSFPMYHALAEEQHTVRSHIPPGRGEIFMEDDDGGLYPAAVNRDLPMVYISPREVENEAEVALLLSDVLEVNPKEIEEKMRDKDDPFEIVKRKLSDDQALRISEKHLAGVHIKMERWRFYPSGDLAAPVVGFVGSDGGNRLGRYGVEAAWEEDLRGRAGSIRQEHDAGGRWISVSDRSFDPAKNGDDLVLTLNHSVQYEAERIVRDAVAETSAESGSLIVMESATGNIVALAETPSFDPNEYEKTEDMARFVNTVVSHSYESGSVFKPFTIAAGIDQGKITPETTYTDIGSVSANGYTIKNSDEKAHGVQTMRSVLEESLNTGTVFVERLLGNGVFGEYVERFGFGDKTGVELPGESAGNIRNLENTKSDINFYTASFGQGISVTPIQLASAYGVLANGGVLMKPNIVRSIRRSDGTEKYEDPVRVRRVVSEETARTVLDMLRSVVENGHGKNAAVPGYAVGGKTGTAQVASSESRGYDEKRTIGTFAGIAPIGDPRFVIVVKINNPQGVIWAESVAAPAFSKMAKFLFDYYAMEPTEGIEE